MLNVGATGIREFKAILKRSPDVRRGDMVDQAGIETDTEITNKVFKMKLVESQQSQIFSRRKEMGIAEICIDCNGNISLARRRAIPTAIRCIVCQEKL